MSGTRGTVPGSRWKALGGNWRALAGGMTWLVAAIGLAILPPPVGELQFGGAGRLRGFVLFLLTVLGALITYWMIRRSRRKDASLWWTLAAISIVATAGLFVAYEWYRTAWTSVYGGQVVVIGSEFTAQAEKFRAANPSLATDAKLILAFAGQLEDVWAANTIRQRCLALALFYMLIVPVAACAAVAALQAITCLKAKS